MQQLNENKQVSVAQMADVINLCHCQYVGHWPD